jgi:hypothetical protein
MTFNPKGSPAQIAWTVFGGLDTELAPPTHPEGLSPDCQDVQFVPGSVSTRAGLTRFLSASAFGTQSVNYNKTFLQPTLKPLNLFLTGNGFFYAQDPSTANPPGLIFDTIAGAYATSITAFGREYIAISDGQVALDIPRQYDPSLVGNSQWRRVTQDGPAPTGNAMTVVDAASSTITISSGSPDGIVPNGVIGGVAITAATNVGQVVTITTQAAHGFSVNDIVIVYGVTPSQYNGSYTVTSIPTSTSFTYAVGASFGAGTSFGTAVATKATVHTTTPHGLIAGETIVISGDSDNNYNNSQTEGIGILPGTKCKFYAYNGSSKGAFSYFNGALPGSTGSFSFASNHSIMFNPSLRDGTVLLPGVPADTEDISPMNIYGVNVSGNWDSTSQSIGGQAVPAFNMTVTFNLSIPASATYSFRMGHDDGAFMGIGGGAQLVSGTLSDGFNHTVTAEKGLAFTGVGSVAPLVGTNASTNSHNVSYFMETFTVSFPTAGIYPCEIDYQNWESAGFLTLQYSNDGGVTWKTILPGVAAFNTPPTWTVNTIIDAQTFTFNSVFASSIGEGGIIQGGGLTAPGVHQLCVSFLTDTGFITKPSQIVTWTAAGNKKVQVNGLPIGPPNVTARICHFTGSGGANFFYLPVPSFDPTTGATVATATVVNNNTDVMATFDFSDNTLFNGIGVDITGNNLFNMITLGPVAGVFSYSQRLVVWGDTNKINNLWNMGMEGGTSTVGGTVPLGWDLSQNAGGALVSAGDFYLAWQITGNGLNVNRGQIQQPAYQDSFHIPILTPNTQYTFQTWAYCSTANMTGSITADFFSSSQGVLATASIAANTLGIGQSNGAFVSAQFSALTPATIPTDTILRLYATNLNNNQSVTIDENMIVFTENPTILGQARMSYGINPEAFDGVTGVYAVEYSEALRQMKIIRDNLYTLTSGHLVRTTDNGVGEPATWTNYTVSDIVGGMSVRCFDVGEGWGMFAAESGLYAFSGGHPEKISQEIQTLWDAIDPNQRKHAWVTNDPINRRVYIGVPLTAYSPTGATFSPASCNKLLVLDYRNLNTAEAIQGQGPVRLGFSGKLIATDFARKWTVWNIPANHGAIMSFSGDTEPQIVFAGGNGAGLTTGFGNSYSLNTNKGFDDDYGVIGGLNGEGVTRADGTFRPTVAYYVTYFAPSHEQEQIYQTGSARKLFPYLTGYVSGLGSVQVVPLIDRLGKATTRPPKGRPLSATPSFDLEWPLNIQASRVALLIYSTGS